MNYTDIKSLAQAYSDRYDQEVINNLDNYLRIVEARINKKLKVADMSVRSRVNCIVDQEYYGLPNDFGGLRDIEWNGDSGRRQTLKYVNPEQMNALHNNGAMYGLGANDLRYGYYTIIADNQLQVFPVRDQGAFEIVYYQRVVPLDDTNTENWLSQEHPDVYNNGMMVEISAFVKDANATALWETKFQESLAEMILDDWRARWSGTAPEVRVG